MNQKKNPLLIILILVLACTVIAINFWEINLRKNTLTIGLTPQQMTLLSSKVPFDLGDPFKVKLVTYETEQALLQAIYAKKVDVYILDTYRYIEQFAKLPSSRAVFGIPSDYYLITLSDEQVKRPRVGMLSNSISEHLLKGKVYSEHLYSDYKECLQALNNGLIDQAVLQERYVDESKFKVLSKLSSLGYKEDLLIVSTSWLEKNDDEDLALLNNIASMYEMNLEKPNETQLVDVMTELFTSENIPTRYYYKDLVYTTGL